MVNMYVSPEYLKDKFHCARCGVFAKQRWSVLRAIGNKQVVMPDSDFPHFIFNEVSDFTRTIAGDYVVSECDYCRDITFWKNQKIMDPRTFVMDQPNPDMSSEVSELYLEAATVFNDSPRAAAALLRLALQVLCKDLGEVGKNLNEDIAALVKKGLDSRVQKAMDSLRVIGNNGVHPGEINLKEDTSRVLKMFGLINYIADRLITQPKELDSLFDGLPDGAKAAIEKRNENALVEGNGEAE